MEILCKRKCLIKSHVITCSTNCDYLYIVCEAFGETESALLTIVCIYLSSINPVIHQQQQDNATRKHFSKIRFQCTTQLFSRFSRYFLITIIELLLWKTMTSSDTERMGRLAYRYHAVSSASRIKQTAKPKKQRGVYMYNSIFIKRISKVSAYSTF